MALDFSPTEWAFGIGGGLTGLGLFLSKFRHIWAGDSRAAAAASADTGIIERLEKECKRLSEQNDKLAKNVNDFQIQIGNLQMQLLTFQTENNKLSIENGALRGENLSLREEIMDLRKEVHELGQELVKMQTSRNSICDGCKYGRPELPTNT